MSSIPSDEGLLSWILWAAGGVVTALASVVAYLYRTVQTQNTEEIKALQIAKDECEEDRIDLRNKYSELNSTCTDLRVRIASIEGSLHKKGGTA
tara:strand:+ start:165 stop:446 length:282 start_codon:yes stop_codon:yes gene_type:complete